MRNELELIERIEKYLRDELSYPERVLFEKELKASREMQAALAQQQMLVSALSRLALKAAASQAHAGLRASRRLVRFGIGGAALVSAVVALVLFTRSGRDNHAASINEHAAQIIETGDTLPVHSNAPDRFLPAQVFSINASKGNVIETDGGIVFAIPAGAIVDSNGKAVSGEVGVVVREALDPMSIIQAGLSTMSDDKLLETGGMFYISASKGDQALEIDPKKQILAQVPANERRSDMMLFDGQRMPDGSINWVDPKPLENFLTPVDIHSLNFYPPEYKKRLAELGYDISEKKFLDSLYLSFAWEVSESAATSETDTGEVVFEECYPMVDVGVVPQFPGGERALRSYLDRNIRYPQEALDRGISGTVHIKFVVNADGTIGGTEVLRDIGGGCGDEAVRVIKEMPRWSQGIKDGTTVPVWFTLPVIFQLPGPDTTGPNTLVDNWEIQGALDFNIMYTAGSNPSDTTDAGPHGINPARIMAIWSDKFANTFIATREFEERMQFIHRTCREEILDLYVNNIDKSLSEVDRMVSEKLSGSLRHKFLEFAERGDGRVNVSTEAAWLLRDYYTKQSKAIAQAAAKTQREFWAEQQRLDREGDLTEFQRNTRLQQHAQENFRREFEINLDRVYRQLGVSRVVPVSVPPATASSQRAKAYPKRNRANVRVSTGPRFTASVRTFGWKNIDRVAATVWNATQQQTSTKLNWNGKRLTIIYWDFSIQVADQSKYDRLVAYVVPNKLSSFQLLNGSNGLFNGKLNSEISYKLIVLGYSGDQLFIYSQNQVQPKQYQGIQLTQMERGEIEERVNLLAGRPDIQTEFEKELDYLIISMHDAPRRQSNQQKTELRKAMEPVVFPCATDQSHFSRFETPYDSLGLQ